MIFLIDMIRIRVLFTAASTQGRGENECCLVIAITLELSSLRIAVGN